MMQIKISNTNMLIGYSKYIRNDPLFDQSFEHFCNAYDKDIDVEN